MRSDPVIIPTTTTTSTSNTSSSSSMPPSWRMMCFALVMLVSTSAPTTSGFQVTMEYKPPVKSSVKKLYDQRFSSSGSSTAKRQPSNKSSHAGVYAPPIIPRGNSFEERMRDLVLGKPGVVANGAKPNTAKRRRSLPANVKHVETLQEYKQVVGDEKEKLVAVRFYATYCKACKAVAPHFYHLATQYPDMIFVDVPVTPQNAALHQGLGVPSLPYGHIYHPRGGLVEELKLTRKHIAAFRNKIDSYVNGACMLPEEDDSN